LGVESFATHHLPLEDGPAAYRMFQEKRDGAVKVVFRPGGSGPTTSNHAGMEVEAEASGFEADR
jgi:hypothetical protein